MAVIQWNQIKPDFSSSNNSMQNAMSGLSNAGTVFDKLRQSILDEEQRALDNAYKQQTFDENVRQFELQQALNREKFDEEIRQFDAEQAWKAKNAEDERKFKAEEAVKANQRARELAEFTHGLDQKTSNAKTEAYNALNTFFMHTLKETNDPVKAAEATRAYHNANYPSVLFDEDKIFGNLASTVTQGYSPESRLIRDITTVREGVTAGQTLAGVNKTLKDDFSNYAMRDNTVWQEDAYGNIFPVPDTPQRKQYLSLRNDQVQLAQIEQTAKDRLVALGLSPAEINRVLNDIGSKEAIDVERALLTLASRNNVVHPENIPIVASSIQAADTARDNIAAADEAKKELEKQYTPDAYNKVYSEVYKGAVEAGNDVFNVSKNPELNASIKLLDEAMRKAQAPASEFKILLEQLRDHDYSWYKFKNDDITSKELNNPVLKAYKDKYLPNLGKPETEEKPETPATTNTTTTTATTNSNTSNNLDVPETPNTEKLENTDIEAAAEVIRTLEARRKSLESVIRANSHSSADLTPVKDRMAILNAAIASLRKNTPITVSNPEAHAYLRNAINDAKYATVSLDAQGNAVFAPVPDLADRLLRLEEAAKTGK